MGGRAVHPRDTPSAGTVPERSPGSERTIAVFNAGSSSVRFALFSIADPPVGPVPVWRGGADRLDQQQRFTVLDAGGSSLVADETADVTREFGHDAALQRILSWFDGRAEGSNLAAAGHRVVHGGARFAAPVLITPEILGELEALIPLALLHQPHNLRIIRALAAARPGLPQVACFDTSFHRTQAPVAQRLAIPAIYRDQGVRRYGFHGLSYEYIASALPKIAGPAASGRVVVAHLGNGASLCAMREGRSVATTMGFSTLDGITMGTRCGSLDPGVVLYLLRQEGMSAAQIEELLYHRSGLLGLSGISHDMRRLLASPDPRAGEAVESFVYRIVRELGSLAAALGGLDALVFTAGIGEHAPRIRAEVCEASRWLGVELDEAANRDGGPLISAAGSRVSVWVIPTDEELLIARHTARFIDS